MATTSWKAVGSGGVASRASSTTVWSSPTSITANDNAFATATRSAGSSFDVYSEWIYGSNFGFTTSDIPSGSTIDGIEVRVSRLHQNIAGTTISYDSALHLTTNGTSTTGSNKAEAGAWPTSETAQTYGNSTDMWGTSLTDSDIRSSSFGVLLSARLTSAGGFVVGQSSIDVIEARIHYTEGAPSRRRSTISFIS